MLQMDTLRFIYISVAGLLAGVAVGGVGGLSLGWLLALGYHRRGPGDYRNVAFRAPDYIQRKETYSIDSRGVDFRNNFDSPQICHGDCQLRFAGLWL